MLVLGIETSCDETAAAVVRDGKEILSNVIYSQVKTHMPYGGVKDSGLGREGLRDAIQEMTEPKLLVMNLR